MTERQLINLVEQYFAGVDAMDFRAIARTLADDCVFTVETHGVRLTGLDEIEPMFRRLWENHTAVCHEYFTHVPAPETGRIAVRFSVINTHHDGSTTHKSNCNFFETRNGRFSTVAVYMAGDNTLSAG